MKILVLNCGSSSIKYQLVDMANNAEVMAKGLLERIGGHQDCPQSLARPQDGCHQEL